MTNSILAVVTYYCACKVCCGPNASGITASGARVKQGVTIAAPRNIKLGTKVTIDGHKYTVQDRTALRYNGRWDIYVGSHKEALRKGISMKTIYIN